jgi:molybdopterin-binding protein
MKLSARNQIRGKVVEVRKGTTTAHVRIDIGNGVIITSSITNEAIDDLGLRAGDEAIAVIKASDVMVLNSDRTSFRKPSPLPATEGEFGSRAPRGSG